MVILSLHRARLRKIPSLLTAFPDVIASFDVRGTSGRAKANFFGVEYHYADLYQIKFLMGRFFNQGETDARPPICVISDVLAHKIFGYSYPIGQRVRVENRAFEVVGVFKDEERLKRMDQYGDILKRNTPERIRLG